MFYNSNFRGVWGFPTLKTLFAFHNMTDADVPECLRSDSFFTCFNLYWERRKRQNDEMPDRVTFVAAMAFIAEEPEPEKVVAAAINAGGKVFKQFFPIEQAQRQHLRNCPPFMRYAVRTSRKQRGGSIVRDTVFNPRTITGAAQ